MYGIEAGQMNGILKKAEGESKVQFCRAAGRVKIDNVYGSGDSRPYSRIDCPWGLAVSP